MTKGMDPQYSIIIPHYDIPDLLMRCLESIPVSKDIQVIVVDDNSPAADTYLDRYPELSRPYLEFIRTTKGGGAGYARNVGLDHATGTWLLFADADDFFCKDMYEILASNRDNEVDIVFFRIRDVLSEDIHKETNKSKYLIDLLDHYIESHEELPLRTGYSPPWGKMIKRELVLKYGIHFDEVKYSNDVYFSLLTGYYAQSIDTNDAILYYRTSRPDSLTADIYKKPEELKSYDDLSGCKVKSF